MNRLLVIALVHCAPILFAQNNDIEREIRRLEQVEVIAVLARDTATLGKLWDSKYVVNSPDNKINFANPDNVADRPVLNKPRTSMTRETEAVTVRGNLAIAMGNETIVPAGELPKSGQTVKRRYTNIWMKAGDSWKLIARHANEICGSN